MLPSRIKSALTFLTQKTNNCNKINSYSELESLARLRSSVEYLKVRRWSTTNLFQKLSELQNDDTFISQLKNSHKSTTDSTKHHIASPLKMLAAATGETSSLTFINSHCKSMERTGIIHFRTFPFIVHLAGRRQVLLPAILLMEGQLALIHGHAYSHWWLNVPIANS